MAEGTTAMEEAYPIGDSKTQIIQIEAKVSAVEEEIRAVEENIRTVERKMLNCDSENEKQYLRDKEKQLRDEENLLRDEENLLRDEKNLLLSLQLREVPSHSAMSGPLPKRLKLGQEPLYAPAIQTSFKFVDFDPDTYVDRTFAAKEDLVKELKRDGSVLFFTGPSGTGKTTTLQMLYHCMGIESTNCHLLSAKYDVLESPIEGGYVFVDDAQCLADKTERSIIMTRHMSNFKALCLAFSPILAKRGERSTKEVAFRHTKMYEFRPFTDSEVDEFATLRGISEDVIKAAKESKVLLPRLILQSKNKQHFLRLLHADIHDCVEKMMSRLRLNSHEDQLRDVLMNAAMDVKLQESESAFASTTGMFYEDDSGNLHLMFSEHILKHLYTAVRYYYTLYNEYSVGAVFEFLTCAQLKCQKNPLICKGTKPVAVGHTLKSNISVNASTQFDIEAAGEYISQVSIDEALNVKCASCLIKLSQDHYGIDFLFVSGFTGPTTSQQLFLIQASVTPYQKRTGPKLPELYECRPEFGGKGLAQFYSEKLNIPLSRCYFVYACGKVPEDDKFTTDTHTKNKVYFLPVNIGRIG